MHASNYLLLLGFFAYGTIYPQPKDPVVLIQQTIFLLQTMNLPNEDVDVCKKNMQALIEQMVALKDRVERRGGDLSDTFLQLTKNQYLLEQLLQDMAFCVPSRPLSTVLRSEQEIIDTIRLALDEKIVTLKQEQ
jgi:hypothetical protein